ncbi:hypothetical protein [Mongoliimonas terrestris]|uniref:hypothetical protein n=1 Tax=Mongoliimonas terrestris TaxID=1709001 RepID=UPI000AAF0D7B|nr:hypothetical protein [Mongoliimonas terrestris]
MKPEPPTLQPDPPEGDRDTIERELARQDKGAADKERKPDADKTQAGTPGPGASGS